MPITIVIADDHLLVREGLRELLKAQGDMHVVGEACDGLEALALTTRLDPDVLLLDIAMPRLGGIETAQQLRKSGRTTKIVIFSMYQGDSCAHQALQAGVQGYVLKGGPSSDVLEAIRAARDGRLFLSHPLRQLPFAPSETLNGEDPI